MADQRSVEMIAFNFAGKNFAYKRFVHGLSRYVSAFSRFMRNYLDPDVRADQCAQYVDDIGITANNATDLTRSIGAVFKCVHQAQMKLTIGIGHFWVRQVEFQERTTSPIGISKQARKILVFLDQLRFPKSKNSSNLDLSSSITTKITLPGWLKEPNLFYKSFKTERLINNQHYVRTEGNIWFSQ